MKTPLDKLNKARTKMLFAFAKLLEEQKVKAKELGFPDDELKILKLKVGRRSGSTTWVKTMLEKIENSLVIVEHESTKKLVYKGYNCISLDEYLVMLPPTTFNDQIVFVDQTSLDLSKPFGKTVLDRCYLLVEV